MLCFGKAAKAKRHKSSSKSKINFHIGHDDQTNDQGSQEENDNRCKLFIDGKSTAPEKLKSCPKQTVKEVDDVNGSVFRCLHEQGVRAAYDKVAEIAQIDEKQESPGHNRACSQGAEQLPYPNTVNNLTCRCPDPFYEHQAQKERARNCDSLIRQVIESILVTRYEAIKNVVDPCTSTSAGAAHARLRQRPGNHRGIISIGENLKIGLTACQRVIACQTIIGGSGQVCPLR